MKKPEWLKIKFKNSQELHDLKKDLRGSCLHTVCESAKCPNIHECFGKKIATFLIMGNACTRNCGFCAVDHGIPQPLDVKEPEHVAKMSEKLGLRHVVVTSVTRDDLPDGGAEHFAKTIVAIKKFNEKRTVEVLTPDFQGRTDLIDIVLSAGPDIFNHNIETVRSLTPAVRSNADYERSLRVLKTALSFRRRPESPGLHEIPAGVYPVLRHGTGMTRIKSGIMVGLGETDEEVLETLRDLHKAGVDIVTIGQYLQPSKDHLPVKRFVEPDLFKEYSSYGESLGIKKVFAGPLVRSSYMAGDIKEVL